MLSYHPQTQTLAQLPTPAELEILHSARLIDLIVEKIKRQNGVIAFSEYMNDLLYAPGLGYYSAGLSKFGEAGDFVTAPEISPLFGRSIANQCQQLFQQGCAPAILEFGAGTGKLCEQILGKLDSIENYFILELSADLRRRQQEYLSQTIAAECFARIRWLDSLPTVFSGVVLANEVLDAMPVSRVQKTQDWSELGVGFDDEKFYWKPYSGNSEAVTAIQLIDDKLGPLPEPYVTEVNLNFLPWLKALNQVCGHAVLLLIDYGYEQAEYYHVQRHQGTLLCHYRHQAHDDALILPGLQDVTASVDFDALADAALDSGFKLEGLVSQSQFLLQNGLLEEAGIAGKDDDTMHQLHLAQQVKTLTLPAEMGEKFKVLAASKDLELNLPAFQRRR